jgi:hypothetical protein
VKRRHLLRIFCLLLGTSILHAAEESPAFIIKNEPLVLPDAEAVDGFDLIVSDDGKLYQAWITTTATHSTLRISQFDIASRTWKSAQTIAENLDQREGQLCSPKIAVGSNGHGAALWQVRSRLLASTSTGTSWLPPTDLTNESKGQNSATLTALPDGRFLAAWTDLRNEAPSLYARIIGSDGADIPIALRANATSPLALVAFPDGSALLAYRSAENDIRDIRTARFREGKWEPPATLNADKWTFHAATEEGPALDGRGGHVAAAWFTAAEGARINVSTSSNAGMQWLIPTRVDDVAPLGRPSLVMLDDGSVLVAWVERDGDGESVFLRRVSPRGTLSVPVRLARNIAGQPRLARVKDADSTPAQIVVSAIEAGPRSRLATRLITLPDSTLLAESDACGCDSHAGQERGYGLKGRVNAVDFNAATVSLAHDEIPGLMKAATTTFKAAPEILAAAREGQHVFARIERIGSDWWLFTLHPLITP